MEIVALPAYKKQAKKLLSVDERRAMETHLTQNPLLYPVMKRTGGFRKARWSRGGSGKSGGVRVIFYYFVKGNVLYLAMVYPKNEQENLTSDQEKQLKQISQLIEESGT